MRRVEVPQEWNALRDYDEIVGGKKDQVAQTLLTGVRASVAEAYTAYVAACPNLEGLSPIGIDAAAARVLRTTIKAGSRNGPCDAMVARVLEHCADICPLCDIDSASTIDHYLPKEIYPEFSLFPHNLTGACGMCNSTKKQDWRDERNRRIFLHVYYDEIDPSLEFLKASVSIVEGRPDVQFTLACDGDDPGFQGHLARHVGRLRLLDRFRAVGRRRLVEDIAVLRVARKRTHAAAKQFLRRLADAHESRHGKLHWQTALSRGAAESDEFITHALQGRA